MLELQTVEERVKYILENYPLTRSSDHDLYYQYFVTYTNKEFNKENFIQAGQSFEGISRARRRIQSLHPELCNEDTLLKRAEMEGIYREHYFNN